MKRLLLSAITVVIACIVLPLASFAAGLCCQLSSGVQESLAGVAAPRTEEVTIQLNYSYTYMDSVKEGSSTRSLDYLKNNTIYTSLPVNMGMSKYTLTAGYGFSSRLKAFVSIPYIRNTMNMDMYMSMGMGAPTKWMEHVMDPVSGPGDITVMGLYRVYANQGAMPTDAITLGAGVKTPTGSFTHKDSTGKLVHAHMQPGTGSWDPLVSVMYAKMINPFLVQTDATYQYAAENRRGYEYGDSVAVNISGKYAVKKEFNLTAAVTYLHLEKTKDRNGAYYDPVLNESLMDDPANTGGDSVWFSPGIQLLPLTGGMIDVKMQLPVWEKVNGIQLVSGYRFLIGIAYSF